MFVAWSMHRNSLNTLGRTGCACERDTMNDERKANFVFAIIIITIAFMSWVTFG